jgi:D-glycero-D-manno-heptose 1,7-bisphosphate phosphatase
MTGVIAFDIDGTLTTTLSGETFKTNPDDIKIIDGIIQGLNFYSSKHYFMFGISNQGGIEKNYKTLSDTVKEMQNTLTLLPQLHCIYFSANFKGDLAYCIQKDSFCLVKPTTHNSFRKPGIGLIETASYEWLLTKENFWFVGDRPEDKECAENAKVKFIWAETFQKRFQKGVAYFNECNEDQMNFLEGLL